MHAATVDIMTKKARLDSDTAMAIAEAFDVAIQHAQLVTVPMLDVRLAELRSDMNTRFAEFATKVDQRFAEFATKVDQRFASVDARFAALQSYIDERFAKVDARFLALEARVSALEAKMEAGFALQEERLGKMLEALKSEVVRWVFLAVLGNTALAAGVNALMNSFQHLR